MDGEPGGFDVLHHAGGLEEIAIELDSPAEPGGQVVYLARAAISC